VTVDFTLNGLGVSVEARPDEMLVGALRREGLLSVRETCGIGVCGACSVLVDGELVTGCLTMVAAVEGRSVTTIEGIAGDPVQRAFADAHAFQCGWCTPGFVLAAKRLLELEPSPSDEQIAEGLGGNLCRCGSYVKITDAVRRCAAEGD
jgi:aerobic-type carbon monoxide dehydrogenase small subunit (CoxS/CutS family)